MIKESTPRKPQTIFVLFFIVQYLCKVSYVVIGAYSTNNNIIVLFFWDKIHLQKHYFTK
jgi:hypothetical protein